jgi:hypothetical protein
MLSLAAALGLVFTGCATAPVPDEKMAVAEAAVKRASSAGTGASAPTELRLATTKLAEARAAKAAGNAVLASRLAAAPSPRWSAPTRPTPRAGRATRSTTWPTWPSAASRWRRSCRAGARRRPSSKARAPSATPCC